VKVDVAFLNDFAGLDTATVPVEVRKGAILGFNREDGTPEMRSFGGWVDIRDFGARDGHDSTEALQRAVREAPVGTAVCIADGTYYINPGVTLTLNQVNLFGNGTLKAGATGTAWLTVSLYKSRIEGVTFDGDEKIQQIITLVEASTYWMFLRCSFVNARVTQVNDPTNTASTGSATAVGIRLTRACQHGRILTCDFLNIAWEGIKHYLGGVGRASRGILAAPFPSVSTASDACIDIVIDDCRFINNEADNKKIDCDAIVFQNVDLDLVPNHAAVITRCYIKWWGWRGLKMQCSGFRAINNEIESGTVLGAGVADTDGYLKCMRTAIEWFGHNAVVAHNKFYGGTCERPINAFSFFTLCTGAIIDHNEITLYNRATSGTTYSLFIKGGRHTSITGNVIKWGDRGIHLRGQCEHITVTGNVCIETGTAGILVQHETDAGDPFFNTFAQYVTIANTVIKDGTTFGIQVVNNALNINVYGTQGNTGSTLVNIGTTVTGEFFGNPGGTAAPITALTPLTVQSTSGVQKIIVRVNTAVTDTITMEDQSGNLFDRYDGGTLQRTLGNTAGSLVLAGTTRRVRKRTTHTTLTFAATVNIDLGGIETQKLTQAGTVTINVLNAVEGNIVMLRLVGDGNAITWNANLVTNTIGTALPATVAAGKIAMFEFYCPDGVTANTQARFLGVQA